MGKIKILGVYGHDYSVRAMKVMAKNLREFHEIEMDIQIGIDIADIKKIKKEYHAIMLGLFVAYNDISPQGEFFFDKDNPWTIGEQICRKLQEEKIEILIYDTNQYSEDFARKNNIPYLSMPELAKNIKEWIEKNIKASYGRFLLCQHIPNFLIHKFLQSG